MIGWSVKQQLFAFPKSRDVFIKSSVRAPRSRFVPRSSKRFANFLSSSSDESNDCTKSIGAFAAAATTRRATCVMGRTRVHETSAARQARNRDAMRARRAEASASAAADEISTPAPFAGAAAAADEISTPAPFASESSAAREASKRFPRQHFCRDLLRGTALGAPRYFLVQNVTPTVAFLTQHALSFEAELSSEQRASSSK